MKSSHWFATFLLAVIFVAAPASDAQAQGLFGSIFGSKPTSSGQSVNRSKRIEIDLTKQQLKAYEGDRVVLKTHISSGRTGNTPTGRFRAGPYKSETHFSSLYHNAPMPWSIQITGHFFIHGYTDVPRHPASKGCVRVPLTGRNPAKRLYKWCDVGTPIRIFRS